jgi:hypothetical protein
MGEKAFIKNQYGKESSHGTAVAATNKILGEVTVPKDRTVTFPEDALGIRARANRSVVNQIHVDGLRINFPNAYFEALPVIMSIGVKGNVTASEQTAGEGDYEWDHTPSLTAANNPDSITLEYGDDTQAYEVEYVMARRIVIEGNVGEDAPVTCEVECFGKQITPTTATAGLSNPTVDSMVANLTKLWIDSDWASLGSTQKTGLLRKYRIEIITGNHPKFWAEGVKTMTGDAESYIEVMMTFTFEGNSDADVIFDAFQAETAKAIRLMIEGTQIGTGEKHSLTVDVYGKFEEVIPLGDENNGNNLHTAIFHGMSDGESTPHMLGVKVITDIGTI